MRSHVRALALLAMLLACKRRAPAELAVATASSAEAPSASAGAPSAASPSAGAEPDVAAASSAAAVAIVEAGVAKELAPIVRPDAGSADPFGLARTSPRAGCAAFAGSGVSERDVRTSFVDGDDLLAIVNRAPTGQLAPDWAPSDLVDLRTSKPASAAECANVQCLRREAASALGELLEQMKIEGFPGKVESAFRSYGAQCGTFATWARKSSFCKAAEQSALPGHSQHQLGTTVDLFTEAWAKDERGAFRDGFGCTEAGRWLREHAGAFGFVMPYPIHPDDRHPRQSCVTRWDIPVDVDPRTGYRYEHWHFRYVGKDAAARFEAARAASGVGTPSEITLEQWLRAERGIAGPDAELPVCDGCNCGACSTLADPGAHACDRRGGALHLDEHGRPIAAREPPSIEAVRPGKPRKWKGRVVEVTLEVPAGTITQPPIVAVDGAGYAGGATFERLSPYPETAPRAFPPLAGAWVVAVEPVPNETGAAWPYRAAIAQPVHGRIYNRANVALPARVGSSVLRVPIPGEVKKAKVAVLQGGIVRGEARVVDLDGAAR